MKTKFFLSSIIIMSLFMFAFSPAMARAQTYAARHVRVSQYDAGTTPDQRQMIGGWRQSSDLQQKITALGTSSVTVFPIPVLFGVSISNISPNFGDPRDGGARTHEGEDIMAVKGTPIVSPTPAVVIRITTDLTSSEGNAVYTANPGGETFVYYHLDRIGEGVVSGLALTRGSLIGYVGNTGNASGGAAHLHFEVHNSAGTPVDPFPRLAGEFSIQEKISFLFSILAQSSDSVSLSRFLVTNFRDTFTGAQLANIALPSSITDALLFIPVTTVPTSGNISLPVGDMDIGSSGALVIVLQKYLILMNSGPQALKLASATATGYFGLITKAALLEYQLKVGISPATGYYGSLTKNYINAHPLVIAQVPPTPVQNSPTGSSMVDISRNLILGMSGDDVQALQRVLNIRGFIVATVGAGSPGSETRFFGSATKAAVIKFQIARGISPAVGYVGPITRASLRIP